MEAIQIRAIIIIYQCDGITYTNMIQLAKLSSLSNRREELSTFLKVNYIICFVLARSPSTKSNISLPDLELLQYTLEFPPVLKSTGPFFLIHQVNFCYHKKYTHSSNIG